MTHDEMIAVIQAHKDGNKIEFAAIGEDTWTTAKAPVWNFNRFRYRVVPEPPKPKYRPWKTVDEVPVGKVVRHLVDNSKRLITGCQMKPDGLEVYLCTDGWFHAAEVLCNYIMDDGTPCGVKEE